MAGPRRMNHYGVPRLCRRPRWTSRVGLSRSVGGLTGRPWPGFRVPAQDLLYNPGGLLSGQEVSCVLNRDPLVLAGGAVIVPFAGHGGVRAIAGALQHQRRHTVRRSCGERRVDRRVGGVALLLAPSVAVGGDRDLDPVRVVPGPCRLVEVGVGVRPARCPGGPQVAGEGPPRRSAAGGQEPLVRRSKTGCGACSPPHHPPPLGRLTMLPQMLQTRDAEAFLVS
jgi:hypothetical protein